MYMRGEAIALQLLISTSSNAGFFVDFINIGYKTSSNIHSAGTMIMWKNINTLHEEASLEGKKLHYSYGVMSGDSKGSWCKPMPLGRSII